MDDFNEIHVNDTHIEFVQELDSSQMREFRKDHPETINRIEDSYNSDTNTITAVFYSDSIISMTNEVKYYYVHSKITISYQPCTKRNDRHDSSIDKLVNKMSKHGGWVDASIKNAAYNHLGFNKMEDRGYGH